MARYLPISIRDRLRDGAFVTPVRHAVVRAVAANQDEQPHNQILGAAGALVVLCESIDIDPVEVIERVRRMARDLDSPYAHQWDGLRDYARAELLK